MQAAAPAPGQPGLSPFARVINIFFSPSKTFVDLKRSANWIVPFLIITLFSLAFAYTVDRTVGYEKVTENQIKLNPKAAEQLDRLSPDQRARRIETSTKISRYSGYGSFLLFLIGYLLVAAVLMGTFNFGFGADLKYSVTLAVVIFSSLPGVLREILSILALFAGVNADGFMIQNPVATNLGALVDVATHPVLYSFASGIDIMKIWTLVLGGIGFACVTRLKRGTTMPVVFGWYLFSLLLGTGMAALFM
jgi:hypothetical protein